MCRSILLLGAGPYTVGVIDRLHAAGYRVCAVDRDPAAPGFRAADAWAAVDLRDAAGVIRLAGEWGAAGILPLNEPGVRTVGETISELGFTGPSLQTAALTNDKGLMRDAWRDAGLPIPRYSVVETEAEARAAAPAVGYPVVLKPAESGGGGRGVSIARQPQELSESFAFAKRFARNGRVVLEEFMEGTELTVETLTYRGRTTVLAMSDKEKPALRTRVATSLNYPAAIPDRLRVRVEAVVGEALAALGIVDGPGHTEVIVGPAGVMLVEAAARGGGGHIFSTIVRAVSGVDFVRETAAILTGGAPSFREPLRRGCVYRFFTPPPGILRAVHGLPAAQEMPGVLAVGIVKQPGDAVGVLSNSLERAGFAVVEGADRAQAMARADAVEAAVRFEVTPLSRPFDEDASLVSPLDR